MRPPAQLTESFRARGSKVTPQRQLLFRLLHGNDTHPTAEALYSVASTEMPGISLRTVYQTLTDLTAMGELRQIAFGAGPARFDPNVEDHHHVRCEVCGSVRDVYVDGTERLEIDGLDGFDAASTAIVFHGRCAECVRADGVREITNQADNPTEENHHA